MTNEIEICVLTTGTREEMINVRDGLPEIIRLIGERCVVNIFVVSHWLDRSNDDVMGEMVDRVIGDGLVQIARLCSALDRTDSMGGLFEDVQRRLLISSSSTTTLYLDASSRFSPPAIRDAVSATISGTFHGIRTEERVGGLSIPRWVVVCGRTADIARVIPDDEPPFPFCGGVTIVSSAIIEAGEDIIEVMGEGA